MNNIPVYIYIKTGEILTKDFLDGLSLQRIMAQLIVVSNDFGLEKYQQISANMNICLSMITKEENNFDICVLMNSDRILTKPDTFENAIKWIQEDSLDIVQIVENYRQRDCHANLGCLVLRSGAAKLIRMGNRKENEKCNCLSFNREVEKNNLKRKIVADFNLIKHGSRLVKWSKYL